MSNAKDAAFRCQIKSGRLCILHSGKIYDVTDFADRHPGGREIIENRVGQDVTQLMKSLEIHRHSPAAFKILDRYYIGEYSTTNGVTHRHKEKNGHVEGHTNGYANGHVNGYMNGHANGVSNGTAKDSVVQFDDLVDWSKPVFWQVGGLGDKYYDWVHSPIDTSLRLFHNDFVETFSKAHWWTVPPFWVPIMLFFLIDSYLRFQSETVYWNLVGVGGVVVSPIFLPVLFIGGFLVWTIVEYIVHRWVFHTTPPPNSKFLITVHFLLHGQHHKSPMDRTRLVFPHVPACVLATVIYFLYWTLAPTAVNHVVFAGTIFGYLCYDMTHYYLHHGNPSSSYFKDLKTYHVKHHFKAQDQGFGISSKLWDFPFGTLIR
ncbi:fatty acid 2-hydroxylase-like [Mercenaria mercenaria]|uniref:fatty acid 2-hydroxylase-like n=1 Tax=Mercenaria mercenaria TaxID=6596 RepID=UPI001E1D6004|nr:fatty acid 2-hydroxylase-like [Mercenaria mercenaria]